MSDKKKNTRISLPGILDYLRGKLHPQEQNRIERESQRDPFLGEALEGFEMLTPDELEKDLGKLQQKLSIRHKKNNKRTLLGIAAGLAAIIAVSTLYYTISNRQIKDFQGNPGVAEQLKKSSPEKEAEKKETKKQEKQSPPAKNEDISGELDGNQAQPEQEQTPFDERTITIEDDEIIQGSGEIESIDPKEESFANDKESEKIKRMEEPVQDAAKAALPETTEAGLASRPAERKKQSSSENTVSEEINIATRESEAKYIMQSRAAQPAPVADTRQRDKKSGEIFPENGSRLVEIQNYPFDYPEEKLEVFENYFIENMIFPDSSVQEARVVIRFLISEEGMPFQPEILETTGKAFSEEALRLLQEGPSWDIPKVNEEYMPEKISIRMRFKRPG